MLEFNEQPDGSVIIVGFDLTGAGLSAGEENNWHCYKIETKTSSSEGTIDGVLAATTSDIPDAYDTKLQPFVNVNNSEGSGVIEGLVRYYEAYNT